MRSFGIKIQWTHLKLGYSPIQGDCDQGVNWGANGNALHVGYSFAHKWSKNPGWKRCKLFSPQLKRIWNWNNIFRVWRYIIYSFVEILRVTGTLLSLHLHVTLWNILWHDKPSLFSSYYNRCKYICMYVGPTLWVCRCGC